MVVLSGDYVFTMYEILLCNRPVKEDFLVKDITNGWIFFLDTLSINQLVETEPLWLDAKNIATNIVRKLVFWLRQPAST